MIGDETVVLLGSGASIAAPSRIVLFGQIKGRLLEAIGDKLGPRICDVAPELLFHALVTSCVDVGGHLVGALDAGAPQPNAVHEALAHHLERGGIVWTTNYDTLVERAWRRIAGSTGSPPNMHKPHGTFLDDPTDSHWVGARDLIFESTQVARPWRVEDHDGLVSDCRTHGGLVVLGYSGNDVNARVAVRDALDAVAASHVRWYEREASAPERAAREATLHLRFPNLRPESVVWDVNPSARFVADVLANDGPSIAADVTCPVEPPRCDLTSLVVAAGRPRTLASLAEMTGESIAERRWLDAAVDTWKRAAAEEKQQLAPDARWARRRRRRLRVRRVLMPGWKRIKPIAARLPGPWRAKARSTWIATHPMVSTEAAARAEGHLASWLPRAGSAAERAGIQLDRSRALRVLGRFDEAVAAAQEALELAIEQPEPLTTTAGRAEMEMVEALRVLGRFDEAIDAGVGRYDTLGMLHWKGWNDYEMGCLHLQLHRFDLAEHYIQEAERFWRSHDAGTATRYDASLGQGYSRLARAALLRLQGDLDGADQMLDEVAAIMFTEGREQIAIARRLQAAEIARARGEMDVAIDLYRSLPDDQENYPALAQLGLAYCTHLDSGSSIHLGRSTDLSVRQHSLFGLALCLQAARDLGLPNPVPPNLGPIAMNTVTRVFGDEPASDARRPIAFL